MYIMIKVAVIACHETEDIELIVPVDVWRRAGMRVDIISLDKKNSVIFQSGTKFSCNSIIEKTNFAQYHALYLPGGNGSKKYFLENWTPKNISVIQRLHKAIEQFIKNDSKYVLAMDEAPKILKTLDLLNPKVKVSANSSLKNELKNYYVDDNVTISKNIITAKKVGDSFEFAFKVIEELLDKKIATEVKNSIFIK